MRNNSAKYKNQHRGIHENPTAQIVVKANAGEAEPLDEFQIQVYIEHASGLETFDMVLDCSRDEPEGVLHVVDADDQQPGIQAIPGSLGGTVSINEADNTLHILRYREEAVSVSDGSRLLALSARLRVPEDAPVAAMYLIPRCTLYDSSGQTIQHFMGGVKIRLL